MEISTQKRKVTGRPFQKGGDPRINRKGRPKNFDALRALALDIAHEEALSNGAPIVINGHKATVAEVILRKWAASNDPRLQQGFIEIAYGKVPNETILTGRGSADAINVRFIDYRAGLDGITEIET